MVLAGPRARARCALRVTKSVPDYLDRVSLVVEIPAGTLCWEVPTIPSFAGDTLLEERPIMFAIVHFRQRQRPGSVLLPALFVVIIITMLLSAILPLTLSGYGLARADRDRTGA